VKKTLDGAQVEERFPKRRMAGKRKANEQVIPVEDEIRGMESYAQTIDPEVQRRVEGINRYASQLLDRENQQAKQARDLADRAQDAPRAARAAGAPRAAGAVRAGEAHHLQGRRPGADDCAPAQHPSRPG
jgi:hypothetical protein